MAMIAQLDDSRIDALSLAEDDWLRLKESDDRKRLRMPLCGIRAVAKNRGPTQFFSHYRVTECDVDHGGESAQHQAMKEAVAHAINKVAGWRAVIEHPHASREWIIDVMAVADDGRMHYAFEVQLSGQAPEEYQRRSQRYLDSGYMPIWLIPRDLPYNEVKVPTLTTGYTKTSEIPERAVELLNLPASSDNLKLRAELLGGSIAELLKRGHNWHHGSPAQQVERMRIERERQDGARAEAERRNTEWQALIDDMNQRTAPVDAAFGHHIIRTQNNLYVRASVTQCWQERCRHPMLIWHAWTPHGYWAKASSPPDITSKVGLKRFENSPQVHRAVDRWIEVVDCDVDKAEIDLRRTTASETTYSAFVCPECDSVFGQKFISVLLRRKWALIASPRGTP